MKATGLLNAIGRVFLCLIFFMSAVGNKIPEFANVSKYMAAEGVPMPDVLLAGAIAFLILGSLSVILGFKARLGATMLLVFLLLATYYFHDFWKIADEQKKQVEMIAFMKNLALAGAMLIIIARGAGPVSLDGRKKPGAA